MANYTNLGSAKTIFIKPKINLKKFNLSSDKDADQFKFKLTILESPFKSIANCSLTYNTNNGINDISDNFSFSSPDNTTSLIEWANISVDTIMKAFYRSIVFKNKNPEIDLICRIKNVDLIECKTNLEIDYSIKLDIKSNIGEQTDKCNNVGSNRFEASGFKKTYQKIGTPLKFYIKKGEDFSNMKFKLFIWEADYNGEKPKWQKINKDSEEYTLFLKDKPSNAKVLDLNPSNNLDILETEEINIGWYNDKINVGNIEIGTTAELYEWSIIIAAYSGNIDLNSEIVFNDKANFYYVLYDTFMKSNKLAFSTLTYKDKTDNYDESGEKLVDTTYSVSFQIDNFSAPQSFDPSQFISLKIYNKNNDINLSDTDIVIQEIKHEQKDVYVLVTMSINISPEQNEQLKNLYYFIDLRHYFHNGGYIINSVGSNIVKLDQEKLKVVDKEDKEDQIIGYIYAVNK